MAADPRPEDGMVADGTGHRTGRTPPPVGASGPIEGKVPAVTIGFWLIKILATTLGVTGGDALTMGLGVGYLIGTAFFATVFVVAVAAQMAARRFHPPLFWFVIVATTTVGTTMADLFDRSLGIGYLGGSAVLAGLLALSLTLWRTTCGSISIATVASGRAEAFYWATVLFSQTLGTALGDFLADDGGLGFGGGALVFAAGLAVVVGLHAFASVSRTALFWAAFVLTRPLGATVGDFLDKPLAQGGLGLDRFAASLVLGLLVVVLVLLLPQRAETIPRSEGSATCPS